MPSPARRSFVTCLAAALLLSASKIEAEDWTRFRGPNGSGVSAEKVTTPVKWSPSENVKWTADLPGSGVSSPIVVGDRVFVTCYSGYGLTRNNPGQIEDLKRHLVCVEKASGKQLWEKTIDAKLPEDPYTGIGVTAHGYASHTPVSDGERVYVFFGKSGVYAFDLEGKQLWHTEVGTGSDPWAWGSASSPVLYQDKVIVTASAESQSIVALDCETGKEAWRQEAGSLDGMWGTPVLVELDEGKSELVMSVPGEIWGVNPDNGKLRWYCIASRADQAHTSAVYAEGMVFAVTGRGGASAAVMPGGKGDVSETNLVWSGNQTSRFGTPIVYQGKMYLIANGVVRVIDTTNGEQVAQKRLTGGGGGGGRGGGGGGGGGRGGGGGGGGGRGRGGFGNLDYASPVIADGKLYYLNGKGETFVYSVGEDFKQLSVNKVTEDSESFGGTPAVSGGQLFIRSSSKLYCIGG